MRVAGLGEALCLPHLQDGKFWKNYKSFADIGGNRGHLAESLVSKHPHLKGYNCDLPSMAVLADEFMRSHDLIGKVTFMNLNFFTDPYPEVDVIILGHVLHMFSAERRQILLERSYTALPKGGAVIQVDFNVAKNSKEYSLEDLAS